MYNYCKSYDSGFTYTHPNFPRMNQRIRVLAMSIDFFDGHSQLPFFFCKKSLIKKYPIPSEHKL